MEPHEHNLNQPELIKAALSLATIQDAFRRAQQIADPFVVVSSHDGFVFSLDLEFDCTIIVELVLIDGEWSFPRVSWNCMRRWR